MLRLSQAMNNQVVMLFETNQPHALSFKDSGIDPKTWGKKGGFLAKDKKGFQFCSKILYVPKQDYSSRLMIVESAIRNAGVTTVPQQLVQTLSHVAKFYAPGPLVTAIRATITQRRLARLVRKPLQ
eukprot:SAG31_NODE_20908_length_562_cov_1.531317_1_plen_125_part_10